MQASEPAEWADVPLPPPSGDGLDGRLARAVRAHGGVWLGEVGFNAIELQAWLARPDAATPPALAAQFLTGAEPELARLLATHAGKLDAALAFALAPTGGALVPALLALHGAARLAARTGGALPPLMADLGDGAEPALGVAALALVARAKGPAAIAEDALTAHPALVGPDGAAPLLAALLADVAGAAPALVAEATEAYFRARLAATRDEPAREAVSRERARLLAAAHPSPAPHVAAGLALAAALLGLLG